MNSTIPYTWATQTPNNTKAGQEDLSRPFPVKPCPHSSQQVITVLIFSPTMISLSILEEKVAFELCSEGWLGIHLALEGSRGLTIPGK